MDLNLNEDRILMSLNDINITEDELSSEELTDIEKKQLRNDILGKIKPKRFNKKRWSVAAAVIALICIYIPLTQKDVLASVLTKLSIIPGIGEVMTTEKGLVLKDSLSNNSVTLNTMYIDREKILITLTINSEVDYYDSSYVVSDNKGNTYKLKVTDRAGQADNTATYKAEFIGSVKDASKYTLSVMDKKASFVLRSDDFMESLESRTIYSTTNGKTTLNITAMKKESNILKIDYYVSDDLNKYSMAPSFNWGTFKDEEENNNRGFEMVDSSIEWPYFKLYDSYNNSEYGHSSSTHLTYENESLFDLKKLTGTKLKLSLPSVVYNTGNKFENNDFKIELDVPKIGKTMLNMTEEYQGFKYKIISIERLSDNKVEILYEPLNVKDSKLQIIDMGLSNYKCSSSTDTIDGKLRNVLVSEETIGEKLEVNSIYFRYASVGPFEIEFDLNDIK